MNAGQLIKALSKFNPSAKVLIAAADTGYHEVGTTERLLVVLNAQKDTGWDGPYVDEKESSWDSCTPAQKNQARIAIVLRPDYRKVDVTAE